MIKRSSEGAISIKLNKLEDSGRLFALIILNKSNVAESIGLHNLKK